MYDMSLDLWDYIKNLHDLDKAKKIYIEFTQCIFFLPNLEI